MTELEKMNYLSKLVNYNQETGSITWKIREGSDPGTMVFNSKFAGKECRSIGTGYIQIGFNVKGKLFTVMAHRLAWFITHDTLPTGQLDHINGNKLDNKIVNLRDVSRSINSRNAKQYSTNTSGVSGVYLNKVTKKWFAQIQVHKKKYYLGCFENIAEAEKAASEFRKNNGFTDRHGVAVDS